MLMHTDFGPYVSMADLPPNFWAKVDVGLCWEWTGANIRGYGQFSIPGLRVVYTHRLTYALAYGGIPEGLTIDHLCRNVRCCNPDHLEAVSMRVNIDRSGSPSVLNRKKTVCKFGHELAEPNVWVNGKGERRCRECTKRISRESHQRVRAAAKEAS